MADRSDSLFRIGAAGIGRKQVSKTLTRRTRSRHGVSRRGQQGASRAALERAERPPVLLCGSPCSLVLHVEVLLAADRTPPCKRQEATGCWPGRMALTIIGFRLRRLMGFSGRPAYAAASPFRQRSRIFRLGDARHGLRDCVRNLVADAGSRHQRIVDHRKTCNAGHAGVATCLPLHARARREIDRKS
jgi:hypothetical protein